MISAMLPSPSTHYICMHRLRLYKKKYQHNRQHSLWSWQVYNWIQIGLNIVFCRHVALQLAGYTDVVFFLHTHHTQEDQIFPPPKKWLYKRRCMPVSDEISDHDASKNTTEGIVQIKHPFCCLSETSHVFEENNTFVCATLMNRACSYWFSCEGTWGHCGRLAPKFSLSCRWVSIFQSLLTPAVPVEPSDYPSLWASDCVAGHGLGCGSEAGIDWSFDL